MAGLLSAEGETQRAINLGIIGIAAAALTLILFLQQGTAAYMFVLFGGGFAVVVLGIAIETYRASRPNSDT